MRRRESSSVAEPATAPRVIVVDHTSSPGGAELALPRLAENTELDLSFAFLEPVTSLSFAAGTSILQPSTRLTLVGQLRYLRRLLRDERGSVIVSNTLRAALLVAIVKPRRQTHVQILHDGLDRTSLSLVKRVAVGIAMATRVSTVLPNSAWTADTVPRVNRRLVGDPIYSPSGDAVATGTARRAEAGTHPLRLLSLSRLVDWKGIHVLLQAMSLLRDLPASAVTVTIAGDAVMGDPGYVDALQALATQTHFSIDFVGHQDDISFLMKGHDVLVHASIRPEPYGQVIVQGLGAGLTVIATRGGGPSEILEGGHSGLLVTPGDPHALAAAIRRLTVDKALRRDLARAGHERWTHFTDVMCTRLFDEGVRRALTTSTTRRSM